MAVVKSLPVSWNKEDGRRTKQSRQNSEKRRRGDKSASKLKRTAHSPHATLSYVKVAKAKSPGGYCANKEIEKLTYSEMLSASHALSIAQNKRMMNWNEYPPRVKAFVLKSIVSNRVNRDLAAINRQIVLRIDEQE